MAKPVIVIENLEEPTPWVIAEYVHAHQIAGGNLVVANASEEMISLLKRREPGIRATPESAASICSGKRTVLLDPDAEERLTPETLSRYECAVVGGIMGDYPRRGRTREIRRVLPWADTVNIGDEQFSVDGTVYVLAQMLRGRRLEDIPVVVRPSITVETPLGVYTVELPFAYPLVDGEPLISKDVLRYLARIQ